MIRFEKKKLIIEVDCGILDPEEELVSLYNDFILLLKSQHDDYFLANKNATEHILEFLAEMIVSPEQIKRL
ncbi:MAG: hypothetical protein SPF43_07305 [Bacteroidales bacterium]|nr:hypothetical protein [Parabacteroides sp.]MDY5622802.1 hypothetical protein [Bacteroidales bacterium]